MDRGNQIKDYIVPFQNKWLEDKAKKCSNQSEPGLAEQAEKLLIKVNKAQEEGDERLLSYISLFHFKSSLWTGSYCFRICASDEALYLNPMLAEVEWAPEKLYMDVPDLKNTLEKYLRKHFVRLSPYELDFAARIILEDYQKLAEVYWSQTMEKLVKTEIFQTVGKNQNWVIFSGTYMDKLNIVLQSKEGGE